MARWQASGDAVGAIADATRALDLLDPSPETANVRLVRAAARATLGDSLGAAWDVRVARLIPGSDKEAAADLLADVDSKSKLDEDTKARAKALLDQINQTPPDDPDLVALTREATRLDPSGAGVWAAWANASARHGDMPAAIAAATIAIGRDENDAEPYIVRGLARAKYDDLKGALADADKARRLAPERLGVEVAALEILSLSDPSAALKRLDDALDYHGWTDDDFRR
jgi:tetratricopeptide (TPR) repeat protein